MIIPLLAEEGDELKSLADYIVGFDAAIDSDFPFPVQVVVVDQSDDSAANYLDNRLSGTTRVLHYRPTEEERKRGKNGKLNNVVAGLALAKYDRILLVDDHYRVSPETLKELYPYYDKYDGGFQMLPRFDTYPLGVLVDMAGAFVTCLLSGIQFFGHNAFWKNAVDIDTFPKDVLFDDFAIFRHIKRRGRAVGFVRRIALECTQSSDHKFLQQRVRYAYENLFGGWKLQVSLLLCNWMVILPVLQVIQNILAPFQDTITTISKALSPPLVPLSLMTLVCLVLAAPTLVKRKRADVQGDMRGTVTFENKKNKHLVISFEVAGFVLQVILATWFILTPASSLLDQMNEVVPRAVFEILEMIVTHSPIIVITLSLLLGLIGQMVYGRKIVPPYTFIFSPVWLWSLTIATLIAIVLQLRGGVRYGEEKIQRPY
ncbi:Glycosyltransferase, catalytic subunit of cellulose synthase and poly-beta-1,6-N-acetylglucosamine synthase [Seinonella peptonophila]|uniref:Glycosyltransferase, catalytic subunit of cellulose synthase and poly-beta-1,6-N-acetylglucosamine synthase n=2 Tax=Seinonella peptonophila TaxID=112248 RepID=A0A1M5B9Z7_9BACL|nr:Glycosyltransferase, catalytic subunit of cellulose synthase and poly-beta-1,6-N-acetylglucosamine synthase [Seinonella peptonophila]